jgi:acetyl-CoA acetyltransferase
MEFELSKIDAAVEQLVSDAPAMSWRRPASPASSSSPMGQWGHRLCSRSPSCYMKTYGLTHEQLAIVSVVQRQWADKNPHRGGLPRLRPRCFFVSAN